MRFALHSLVRMPSRKSYLLLVVKCRFAGFKLTVLTVDGPMEVQLPCNLEDDMNIVIENKGVPTPEGRGSHHVRAA